MKPVLFNTPMSRALSDGAKSATRRGVRPQPDTDGLVYDAVLEAWTDTSGNKYRAPCSVGDILYVRETWTQENGEYYFRTDFESDYLDPCETLSGGYPSECVYHPGCEGCGRGPQRIGWKPSIHMPKEAARIFLRVKGVRVERLQDIDDDGVIAEGLKIGDPFDELWDSTIKKSDRAAYGWNANPWVWVIAFERISKEAAYRGTSE